MEEIAHSVVGDRRLGETCFAAGLGGHQLMTGLDLGLNPFQGAVCMELFVWLVGAKGEGEDSALTGITLGSAGSSR